ncbi:hypothetical protein [Methyloglobulus sp.]|uniref:hypothetical protein n=1 Tax=Methyloglobulus sp. TaxID=2518622 RepID=UPI0032B70EBF
MSWSFAVVMPTAWTRPLLAFTLMWAFIPEGQVLPFLVEPIAGSRALAWFLVEGGAWMMVASTMLPPDSTSLAHPSTP